jgi:hypothetical protein
MGYLNCANFLGCKSLRGQLSYPNVCMVVGKELAWLFFSVVGEHLTQCIFPAIVGEAFKQNGMLLQEKKTKEKKIGVALFFPPPALGPMMWELAMECWIPYNFSILPFDKTRGSTSQLGLSVKFSSLDKWETNSFLCSLQTVSGRKQLSNSSVQTT